MVKTIEKLMIDFQTTIHSKVFYYVHRLYTAVTMRLSLTFCQI